MRRRQREKESLEIKRHPLHAHYGFCVLTATRGRCIVPCRLREDGMGALFRLSWTRGPFRHSWGDEERENSTDDKDEWAMGTQGP